MSQKDPPRFEELVEVPTDFAFRVVAKRADGLLTEAHQRLEALLGRPPRSITARPSSKGSYVAIRVVVHVLSHAELRAVYAELGALPDVHLVL
ncbi:MAG: DUF493 domain-containing protein [Alphaproteobacteria bacterium]|nr:DUF493 domain-containing protein [Alphaproteobacteria bacterium]MCB9796342.1 DUF493 domain-containing protein [Alphaproteobacteria bacterium]